MERSGTQTIWSRVSAALRAALRTARDRSNALTLYYVAFVVFMANHFLMMTCFFATTVLFSVPLLVYSGWIDVGVLVLLAAKCLLHRPSVAGGVVSAALVAIGLLTWANSGAPGSWVNSSAGWLFWLAAFVACSEDVRMDRLASLAFVTTAILFFFTVTCGKIGIIENRTYPRPDGVREAAGFVHSNTFGFEAVLVWLSSAAVSFSYRCRYRLEALTACLGIFIVMFLLNLTMAQSRTTTVIWIIAIPTYLVFYLLDDPKGKAIVSLVLLAALTVVITMSYWLMVTYDPTNPSQATINTLLSSRAKWSHYYFGLKPLSWFGTSYADIPPVGWDHGSPQLLLVDNAYCRLLLSFGVVPTILVLGGTAALYCRLLRRLWRGEDGGWRLGLLLGLLVAGFYGLSETIGIRVEWNYFLIGLGCELLYAPSSPLVRGADVSDTYARLPLGVRRALRLLRRVFSRGTTKLGPGTRAPRTP